MITIKPVASAVLGPDARGELKAVFDKHGKEILAVWSLLCPDIDSSTLEKAALTGAEHKGFEKALEELVTMITPQNGEVIGTPAEQYPDIDDDAQWEKPKSSNENPA